MKRKPMRSIDIVNHAVHREASKGTAAMGGIPWCYFQAIKGDLVDKHPVKQLEKGVRRKPCE